MARPRLFLIDSFGFIFRAYHARARSAAPPMRTSTGLSTEAVYIFNNMLRKLLKEHNPAYIAAIFESTEPTHRVQEFAEYKANRTEMPPDLAEQIPYVRRIIEAMRIPILQYPRLRSRRRDRHHRAPRREPGHRSGDRIERQGHAATGGRARFDAQSGQGRHVVQPARR